MSNKVITFSAVDENTGLSSIWTTNLDGTELTQIISDKEMHCLQPSPDPTGRYIAYTKEATSALLKRLAKSDGSSVKNAFQSRDVFVYDRETGLTTQVTTNQSRDDLPQWSKDGAELFIRSSRGLSWSVWRLDISTAFADM